MGRKKNRIEENIVKNISSNPFAPKFIKPIEIPVAPTIPVDPGITINEYLTNYSQNRKLDNVFIKWFRRQDATNPRKPVCEWNELINNFLNEVV